MASTNPSPQALSEFVRNLVDDLKNGRVTPEAALVASQQYPYLRAFVAEHNDEIADALQGEQKLRVVLENLLSVAAALVGKELPQFQAEKPDAPLSPNDIVARARAFGRARSEVFAALRGQRTFIHRLIQNWITQTRTVVDKENQQQLTSALQSELEQGLLDGLSPDEIIARVGEGASAIRHELVLATQKLAGLAVLPKELVSHLSTPRPDRLATIAIQTISSTTLSPSAAIAQALSLDRTSDALSASLPKEKDIAAAGVFFRAFASGPTQKAFAVIADALLNQLSPFARQEVIKATFSHALERALAKTGVLTERLGRDFVESELFRVVIEVARKEFAKDTSGGGGVKQARGALEDIVGSFLRGPVMEPLVGSSRETILSYLELLAMEARLPRDKKVLFPDHAPAIAALSLLASGQPEAKRVEVMKSTGFASSTAFQTAVSGFTQRLPSWQAFYLMLLSLGAPTVYASLSSGGSLVAPPSVFTFGLGKGLGTALGWVGRGLSGAVLGVGGGFVGMIFGGGMGALFNSLRGPRQPDGFFDDTPKFLAVAIVFIIVLLFVFPSFFNAKLAGQAAKYAALLVNSQTYNTGGPYEETFPPYSGPFPAASQVDSCPVTSGRITQGPLEGGTHRKVCAYDFAASFGSPVYATHNGCVAAVRPDLPNNTLVEESFGNYVRLVGTNPDGSHYHTMYAHLEQSRSIPSVGTCVNAGDIIGYVDTTGFTFDARGNLGKGTHLHYQYDGGECIGLPAGCGVR